LRHSVHELCNELVVLQSGITSISSCNCSPALHIGLVAVGVAVWLCLPFSHSCIALLHVSMH